MTKYKDPWGDAANQAVGALYKHYLSKPSQADMQRSQMENQLLDLNIKGARNDLEADQFDLNQARMQSKFADKFSSAFDAVPQASGPVPQDGSMGPVEPFTQNQRNAEIANVFEQFAPRLDGDTISAARDALGTAGAMRFEDPIQRQLAIDEKATSYDALIPEDDFYTLSPGSVRFDDNNQMVAQAPFKDGGGSYIQQPDGTIISIDGGAPPEMTNSVKSDMQNSQISLEGFKSTIDAMRSLAQENSKIFGPIGLARGATQDIGIFTQGAAEVLGYDGPMNIVSDLNTRLNSELGKDLSPEVKQSLMTYDPSLHEIDVLTSLAVFEAASALAQQEGRSISDQDVKYFQGVVGKPKSLFMNQQKFMTGLDALDRALQRRLNLTYDVTGEDITGRGNSSSANEIDFSELPE